MSQVHGNMELTKSSFEAEIHRPTQGEQIRPVRRRRIFERSKECDGITQAPPTERSLDDLPSHTIPGLTSSQVVQIRKLINARRDDNETWLQRHVFSILLVVLISAFAGIAWKWIGRLETNLLNKTVDVGFDVALSIVENNPELLGEDKVAGLLQLAEREIRQTIDRDISGRLGNLISTSTVTSENLLTIAHNALQQGQHLRAMTLFKLSYQLFKKENTSPDDVARRIGLTVAQVTATVQPLVQADGASRESAVIYGVKYMEGLLKDLRSLKDVSPSVRALAIGRCSVDLARSMAEIGEYEKAVQLTEDGITIMENEFLEEVSKYQYYGYLLNNQGMAYELKKDSAKATICYAKALEAKIKAVDYESEENKKADLDMTKENLWRAQAIL